MDYFAENVAETVAENVVKKGTSKKGKQNKKTSGKSNLHSALSATMDAKAAKSHGDMSDAHNPAAHNPAMAAAAHNPAMAAAAQNPEAAAAAATAMSTQGSAKNPTVSNQSIRAIAMSAIKNQLSLSMQTVPASEETLDPKLIGLLSKYLRSYYTNLTSSSGLYTAWLITILCILTKSSVFGIKYR